MNDHSVQELLSQHRPILMGILNLTPDSFSDGKPHATIDDFERRALKLVEEGSDILDIGGESTRPNAEPVSAEEEMKRLLPLLERIRKQLPHLPISLDTKKYDVAVAAMPFQIQIINDVSFLSDVRLAELALQHHCFYVLMHCRGDSTNMMTLTHYPDSVFQGMKVEVEQKLKKLESISFPRNRVILDPGFGFAKAPEQCVELINNLAEWNAFELPLMFGVSRKRFLQLYTGERPPCERDEISAQLASQAICKGFSIIRTHNIMLTKQILCNK